MMTPMETSNGDKPVTTSLGTYDDEHVDDQQVLIPMSGCIVFVNWFLEGLNSANHKLRSKMGLTGLELEPV